MSGLVRTALWLSLGWVMGCATAYERVAATKSIAEAQQALGSERPTAVNPYPPRAEAWYFGWQHCVLFIDGKLRWSKSVTQTGVGFYEKDTVDCSVRKWEAENGPLDALPPQ